MPAEIIFNFKKKIRKIYLNEFIEKYSNSLKDNFLLEVHNTGVQKVFRKRFRDFFQLNDYVNLWDLSHFNEKNIFKEDYINDCLQYLAILKIIKKYDLNEVVLKNIDFEIIKVLKKYNKKIHFKILIKKQKSYKDKLRSFFLANWFTSIIYFFKNNISIHQKQNKVNLKNKNLIISYFCHYEKNFYKKPFFLSDHWHGLEKIIKKNFFYLNLFIASNKYKKYEILKNSLGQKIENLQEKNFLDNYFNSINIFKIIVLSILYSYKFYFLYFILRNKVEPKIPLLEISYKIQKRSFSGITCFENLKSYYALKRFFTLNPNLKKCVYLMENQSWEKILLKFCYSKKIISYGYIHATMPFWHLNYYQPKILNKKNFNLPTKILTVSKINLNLLIRQGINKKKLKLVEALRYDWLNKINRKKLSNRSNKILVFGDYNKSLNNHLLKLTLNFLNKKKDLFVYFKPHPGDITNYNLRNKRFKIIYNLPKKLNFKFYIFSNSTSASAEYTHLSNNIAIFKPKLSINLSPFKDLKNSKKIFFSNEIELLNIINSKNNNKFKDFFYLNKDLTKWKQNIL